MNPAGTTSPRRAAAFVGAAALLAASRTAFAHDTGSSAEGWTAGLLHPVSGLDHVLAMVAVGLWGAQLGRPALWLLPVAFPIAMAAGGFLGLAGVGLPGVEIGIALSAIALGAAVLTEARPHLALAAGLVGAFAVFHGHAHGTELGPGGDGPAYSIGFVVSTGCLHGLGIALGTVHRWRAGKVGLRAAGAAIAVAGVLFLVRAAG